jgi:uncharacterized membrane protein YccC
LLYEFFCNNYYEININYLLVLIIFGVFMIFKTVSNNLLYKFLKKIIIFNVYFIISLFIIIAIIINCGALLL